MNREPSRKRLRWPWMLPSGILLFLAFAFAGIWAFRRPLIAAALVRTNETIPGTIRIEDGSLTWRRFFTRLSLSLDGLVLLDDRGEEVLFAENVGAVVNPMALLSRRISVSSLILVNVTVVLEADDEGIFNLYAALGLNPTQLELKRAEKKNERSGEEWRRWSASIDGVKFEECRVQLVRGIDSASGLLEYLELSFHRKGTDGAVGLKMALSDLRSRGLGPGYFRGKRYALNLEVDVDDGMAVIHQGFLDVQGARISVAGTTDLFYPFSSDLSLEAQGTDTALLLSFLPPGVSLGDVEPAGNGSILIEGRVRGALAESPDFLLSVSCSEFALRHRPTGLLMDNISFNAEAVREGGPSALRIDGLSARFPDGSISAEFFAADSASPRVSVRTLAGLDLGTLATFFVFPGSESIDGRLDLNLDVAGRFDGNGNLVEREREEGSIELRDFRYLIPGRDSGIRNLDLLFRVENGMMEVRSLDALTDSGELMVNGSFGNIWPLILGGDGPLQFTLGIESPHFNPSSLFKDPEVATTWDKALEDLAVSFVFDTEVSALREADPIPEGIFSIKELRTRLPSGTREVSNFTGSIEIGELLTAGFLGRLNDSEISLSAEVDGYRGLFDPSSQSPVQLSLRLNSPLMLGTDLIPFSAIDESLWEGRGLQNVILDLSLAFNNSEWFASRGHWPDGRWVLNEFSGITSILEKGFNLNFNLQSSEGRAELTGFSGRVAQSDFLASGYLENTGAFLTGDFENITGHLSLESGIWDMAEILGVSIPAGDGKVADSDRGLGDDKLQEEDSPAVEWNLGGRSYPSLSLEVAIDDFRMSPYHWKDIGGAVSLEKNGLVKLKELEVHGSNGDGWGRFNGTADFSSEDRYLLDTEVVVGGMNLEAASIPMTLGDDSFAFGDVIKGELAGKVTVAAVLNPDLSVNLDESILDVRADLYDGRLVNFPPFVAMADRFKNRNLMDVRLDDLKIQAEMRNGVFMLPRTAVGSTLGYLEAEGHSRTDLFMSYSITVPNSVIDDALRGMMFGSGGNSDGEDEIINAENSGRNRTTVNIVGDSEDFIISLGKRGRPRLEERWERRSRRKARKAD